MSMEHLSKFYLLILLVGGAISDDIYDYGYLDDYVNAEPLPGNSTYSSEQARKLIVEEAVKKARSEILNDSELESVIKSKIQESITRKQNCLKMNESNYFDYATLDCKSCLRERCKEDPTCATECHEYLKRRNLEGRLEEMNLKLQKISTKIEDNEISESAVETRIQIWLIVLTVTVAVMLVLVVVLFITRKNSEGHESLSRTFHPLSDLAAEARRLLGRGGGTNGGAHVQAGENQA